MTTRERAEAVKSAAAEIDAAIVAKGGTTAGGLRNAAAAIAALPSGGEVVPLTVTANGTYTPPEGVDGYAPVDVNVTDWDGDEYKALYNCEDDISVSLTVSLVPNGVEGMIEWGDGSSDHTGGWGTITHTYATRGRYLQVWRANFRRDINHLPFDFSGYDEIWIPRGMYGSYNGDRTYNRVVKVHYPASGVVSNGKSVATGIMSRVGTQGVGEIHKIGVFTLAAATGNNSVAYYPSTCVWIDDADTFYGPGWYSSLASYGLKYLIFNRDTIEQVNNDGGVMMGFSSLIKLVGVKKMIVKNAEFFCRHCKSLIELPDELDMSAATSSLYFLDDGGDSLYRLPSKVTANVSLTWKRCTGIKDKQSVLDFAANLNTCANAGQTITFNAAIKTLLGDDYTTVESILTAKNWAVAW